MGHLFFIPNVGNFVCTEVMTRKELLHRITEAAEPLSGKREASSIAYLVAETLFGLERKDFLVDPYAQVATDTLQTRRLEEVVKELELGCPVQYALGEGWFYGLRYRLTPSVLIPRPETEELVAWVVADYRGMSGLRLLDVCTGSGCIAVSLAKSLKDCSVEATDISEEALAVARVNAAMHGVAVDFYCSDALQPPLQGDAPSAGLFDAIVSNPPYVPASDRSRMDARVVDYEPAQALFVQDHDPLVFYRSIAANALSRLKRDGLLYFEICEYFPEQTAGLLSEMGYDDVRCREDMNGKPRMIRCRKP